MATFILFTLVSLGLTFQEISPPTFSSIPYLYTLKFLFATLIPKA